MKGLGRGSSFSGWLGLGVLMGVVLLIGFLHISSNLGYNLYGGYWLVVITLMYGSFLAGGRFFRKWGENPVAKGVVGGLGGSFVALWIANILTILVTRIMMAIP